MKLSSLAILLGLGFGLPQLYGLLKPAKFRDAVRKFPRSEPVGYGLMLLGTVWFLWNLQQENISDFAAYKKVMLMGFGAVGVATCIYVRDFLTWGTATDKRIRIGCGMRLAFGLFVVILGLIVFRAVEQKSQAQEVAAPGLAR